MAENVPDRPSVERPAAQELSDPRQVRAQPPEDLVALEQVAPKTYAGGIPAVFHAIRHAISEAGPLRGPRLLLRVNQVHGFDCPGCAWPDPDHHRSSAEFCENGAKAVAEEGDAKRITAEFFARNPVAELSRRSDYWLGKQGRLTEPMLLKAGATHYTPVSWEETFAIIGRELNALSSPDEAVFYTSGRTSNEAAFLYQLFVREYGTNNLPDCSNMCHESSGSGLTETIGIGKGTVTLEDLEKAKVIMVVGQNPGTNHPRMLGALQTAKGNGAKIISINPLREAGLIAFKHPQKPLDLLGRGTALTDLFLQTRINGDVAILQGMGKALIEAGSVDRAFVQDRTEDYLAYAEHLARVSWNDIVSTSGVAESEIREAAKLVGATDRVIICWAMGLTQHQNAVDNIREVVNLLLLRGAFGKPGAGACPVRGHSNVQGDRSMGICERPTPAFLDALDKQTGISSPREHGYDVVGAIHAMHEGKAKLFFAMGGNFLSATPDTEYTAAALRGTRLTAHVSTKLHRGHLVAGETALILPCLGRSEEDDGRFVTCENSMSVVQMSRGRMKPAGKELLSEPEIVARLAQATLGQRAKVDYRQLAKNYDSIRELISRVVPGCENYNERVRRPYGFYMPNGPREGNFTTPSGRAKFSVHQMPRWELPSGQLLMMTVRTHDQYNTTIYGLADRYRGLDGDRRVILMNRDEIRELGFSEGQVVDLTSHFRGETRTARRFVIVGYDIPRGCACTYFPEANALVPSRQVAHTSGTPASKSVVISLSPAHDTAPIDPERLATTKSVAAKQPSASAAIDAAGVFL
jgi:molybdopterin-dependent oxidoreductase alpha subunit